MLFVTAEKVDEVTEDEQKRHVISGAMARELNIDHQTGFISVVTFLQITLKKGDYRNALCLNVVRSDTEQSTRS